MSQNTELALTNPQLHDLLGPRRTQMVGNSLVECYFGHVPLDRIDVRIRYRGLNQGFQATLREQIKVEGYSMSSLMALAFDPTDQSFELVDGAHRYSALLQLVREKKWQPDFKVPCIVYIGLSAEDKVIIAANSNFTQEMVQDMSPLAPHACGSPCHIWHAHGRIPLVRSLSECDLHSCHLAATTAKQLGSEDKLAGSQVASPKPRAVQPSPRSKASPRASGGAGNWALGSIQKYWGLICHIVVTYDVELQKANPMAHEIADTRATPLQEYLVFNEINGDAPSSRDSVTATPRIHADQGWQTALHKLVSGIVWVDHCNHHKGDAQSPGGGD